MAPAPLDGYPHQRFLIYLILFATVVTVLETEPSLLRGREQWFGIHVLGRGRLQPERFGSIPRAL